MLKSSMLSIIRHPKSSYQALDFHQREQKALKKLDPSLSYSQSLDEALGPFIFITNTHTDFSKIDSHKLKECQLIIHPNSGYDNFPAALVKELKAPIILGNPLRAQSVSEYILTALFKHHSPLPHTLQWDKERKFPRRLLKDKKILITGHGQIGQMLEKVLLPLCPDLQIYDPYKDKKDFNLKGVDILILTSGLNLQNKQMIAKKELEQLSKNALIINAARGKLIHEQDLISYLKDHPHAHAVLDVFEKEPCDFKIFEKLSNITLTSHVAGVHEFLDDEMIHFEVEVIKDFLNSPQNFKQKYADLLLQNRLVDDELV